MTPSHQTSQEIASKKTCEILDKHYKHINKPQDNKSLAEFLIDGIKEVIDLERAESTRLEAEKDDAYFQRNVLVAALAKLYPSGIRKTDIPGWSDDWHGCCFIDLPSGQISYHYHDSHAYLFADLPPYEKPWDGHDKELVHKRLSL